MCAARSLPPPSLGRLPRLPPGSATAGHAAYRRRPLGTPPPAHVPPTPVLSAAGAAAGVVRLREEPAPMCHLRHCSTAFFSPPLHAVCARPHVPAKGRSPATTGRKRAPAWSTADVRHLPDGPPLPPCAGRRPVRCGRRAPSDGVVVGRCGTNGGVAILVRSIR
ncbi:hypothetical protein PVAP13_8NG240802 [Panicum virgatum]|uniref:Uncharacterized protein n=1 Tax=Panicum virgatum TaxID=38727 RepID=A0A8T0P6S5_PANVG|nr:hypothetical protein PVAP13_8NG240802 [Panicum virgatum]